MIFKKSLITANLAASCTLLAGGAIAHDDDSLPGVPVCLESNIMMADAMNGPFSNIPGPGRLLEMNTTTGERGITVSNPFSGDNAGGPICPSHVSCPGPWKPTGNTSGGENGHAFLTSAAQHALMEFHRDGTPIRTGPAWYTSPSPNGGNFGFVPRILGNGFMPNGNIAQTVCNANFFNASNSDVMGAGESGITYNAFPGPPAPTTNSSFLYFPPVYGTEDRSGDRGTVLILDQNTMEVVDEYSKPTSGPYANDPRWNCPAGVLVTGEGLFISMFHGDAVFVVDWKAGVDDDKSEGLDRNSSAGFKGGKKKNEAKIIRVIDVSNDGTLDAGKALNYDDAPYYDSPNRRDNLRAIRMSEDGTLYGTRRSRSRECLRGEAPGAVVPGGAGPACNPSVFRQHIFVAAAGENHRTGSLALDPGVNVIAGVSINRMSGPGCKHVTGQDPTTVSGDACDVETLYVGVSAGNAGCDKDGDGNPGPGHPANQCFVPGGTVYEYRLDTASLDGGPLAGDGSGNCNGDPNDPAGNTGCAQPIAQFDFIAQGDGTDDDTSSLPDGDVETLDPRMVMHIHEAFNQ